MIFLQKQALRRATEQNLKIHLVAPLHFFSTNFTPPGCILHNFSPCNNFFGFGLWKTHDNLPCTYFLCPLDVEL